jgi:Tfp pilus assembly protein PilF
MQNGDYDGARSDFDAAVKYDGSDYELYINIYENFCGYDMTEEGEQYLEKAFNIKGDGADALASRGRIYYLLGQYDNASAELVSAINKGSTEANLTMAAVCAAQGDDETADYYYQAYVDSGTADSAAMNDLAEYEMSRGNYDKALEYIRKGLAMDDVPNRRELLSNKVIACENVADFGDAWEAIQEYISLYPDDMDAQREYVFLKYRQSEESDTEEILEDEPIDTEGMSESDQ